MSASRHWHEEISRLGKGDKGITSARLAVLDLLEEQGGQSNFQFLRFYLRVNPGSLSNDLEKLRDMGLIRTEKRIVDDRQATIVTITEEGLAVMDNYQARMEEFVERRKDRKGKLNALLALLRGDRGGRG